jgi:hypothetical protein
MCKYIKKCSDSFTVFTKKNLAKLKVFQYSKYSNTKNLYSLFYYNVAYTNNNISHVNYIKIVIGNYKDAFI